MRTVSDLISILSDAPNHAALRFHEVGFESAGERRIVSIGSRDSSGRFCRMADACLIDIMLMKGSDHHD